MHRVRTVSRWLLAAVAALALIAAVGLAFCQYKYTSAPQVRVLSAAPNAVWFAHRWVGKEQPDEAYKLMADCIKSHRITDGFFHIGPLQADGRIAANRYPAAGRLLAELRTYVPALRAQAWIGQVEKAGGGPLDLASEPVRDAIVETARGFLDLGFTGLHINIEPSTGNPHLLTLLNALRAETRKHDAMLSMATDELEPLPGMAWATGVAGTKAGFWTTAYYRQVLDQVDQIAVMTYDTGLPLESLYGNLVRWQTRTIRTLAPIDKTVFIGVPTYEEKRLTFHPDAEHIASASRGVRQGLYDLPHQDLANVGVAIYADWTTDEPEWRVYRAAWLGMNG